MAKGKGAKRDARLTRMNFSKDSFADEAAVSAFLEENSITGCEIIDDGDVWAAKSTTNDDVTLDKSTATRTKHAGVTMFIAEVTGKTTVAADPGDEDPDADEDDDEDDGPNGAAHKAATKVTQVDGVDVTSTSKGSAATDTELRFPANKYDWWAAYMSNEGSLRGILKEGIDYDGLPPGIGEVIDAVGLSTGNVLSGTETPAEKKAKLAQIGEDFAALTFGLFELFNQATDDSTKSANTERRAKAASYVESFSASVTAATKIAEPDGTDANVVSTDKGVVTVDIADADEQTADERLAAIIGKAVDKAVAETEARFTNEIAAIKVAQAKTETTLSRAQSRRSDQSAIDNLVSDENDDDAEEAATQAAKAERIASFAEAMGVRPK